MSIGAGSSVVVKLMLDDKPFTQGLDGAKREAGGFADSMGRSGRRLTTGVTLPLIGAGAAVTALAKTQAEAEAKISSTFDSMGAAAWTSVDALKASASELQGVTTFGDEAILGLQDLLLTFGNVTNGVGEGNQIFDEATRLGLDMSAALGQDLKSSAIQLGKALNDPVAGVSALSRVGVSFTQEQKDLIASLVESGDIMGAQKIILGELENQFGGTAEAIADTDFGKTQQAMNTLGDAGEQLGAVLLPVLAELAGWLKALGEWFQRLSPRARRIIVIMAGVAAAIGPVLLVAAKLVKAFQVVSVAFKAMSAVMAANPWLLLIAAVVALVALIIANWDKIKEVLGKAWEWIKNAAGAVGEFLKNVFQTAIDFLVTLFTTFTPLGIIIKHFDKIKELAGAVGRFLGDAFQKGVDLIKGVFLNFSPLGLIIKHFDKIKELATGVKDWIVDRFNDIVDFMRELPGKVTSAIGDLFGGVRDAFKSAINWIIDKWNALDISVGPFSIPSWVPVVGGKSFHIADVFPDLPRLHTGGIYTAPTSGGEGLAVLRDRERVLPPVGSIVPPAGVAPASMAPVFAPQIGTLVGDDGIDELFERFRRMLIDTQRRNGTSGVA